MAKYLRYEAADGPRYGAIEEYRHFLARFPFREIPAENGNSDRP